MTLSKITRNGQITIPKIIREKLHLEEGDYVDVIDSQEGILLRPKKMMLLDPDQAYYWTEEWQERERRADEDLQKGRVHPLDSLDEIG
ncbi:AbrB/MazE/SpoVT family DNA-binding domain-containing protein [Ferroacidibacillus organovorans]|uniref:SpoVT-AbrB domain-containing protein n=1 Tax=Ferroacidibacillus organovorans TaxID=1765683 RepID=A0A853KC80_9BACL|nr:AbrB/MazE/SpoVT family DNA-binding domain-containing protein [Ferroacidibacillus organovorans]KYP81245.1 hypothetical protein AYJ22_07965 [Ferroacidibacillus organovorans]OAG93749.1 hypothetical protein AYW79_08880 [Ferroacidibacillus organovorans]